MDVITPANRFESHRVRVMWERPVGIWERWPLKYLRKPTPIYVFIGYIQGSEQPLRICLRDDGSPPFVIDNRLAYDGGYFKHGPHANAARYDREHGGHTLSDIFQILHNWAAHGDGDWGAAECESRDRALAEFQAWISRERGRDHDIPSGVRVEH